MEKNPETLQPIRDENVRLLNLLTTLSDYCLKCFQNGMGPDDDALVQVIRIADQSKIHLKRTETRLAAVERWIENYEDDQREMQEYAE